MAFHQTLLFQAFGRYLTYRRDNDELLLFILKQLVQDQLMYQRSRFGGELDVVEVLESDFIDRVSCTSTQTCRNLVSHLFLFQAKQINVQNVGSFYDSPLFKTNRFIYERKRRMIVQTV